MKRLTIQIRSKIPPQTVLFGAFLLLSFCMNGLYSQDSIVPAGSIITKLSTNQFQFLEGPVWYNDSVLLFVEDATPGTGPDIYQYDPGANQIIKWPGNSTHCVGLSCDKDGNLIGASINIIMIDKAGLLVETLASQYNGKPFDNPNDLIADDKGGVYFSDPDFYVPIPPQDKTAIYYIDSTGNVIRVIDDLAKPNGLVLSPDGTKLYAVDTGNKYVYSWNVAPDGSVSGKLSLAELQSGAGSYADGMAIDIFGNIYVATDKGIQVFSPGGVAITTILVPEQPSNCDFGGTDFKTLFITAHKNIYAIDLNYPGYAVSRRIGPNAVNSISDNPSFEIYPNPAGDFLYVKIDANKVNSLEVLNMDGKKEFIRMKKEEAAGFEINTQGLKPGMYLLRIVLNEVAVTRKFIKG